MANEGIAPPHYSTAVGTFRLLADDTYSVPLVPPVAGLGNYTLFSDEEIDAYLVLQSNVYRAVGLSYMALAGSAAQQAESIKDYDLAVDRRQKAEQLRLQAAEYFRLADDADAAGETGFRIVGTGLQYPYWHELAEYPYISQSGLIV